MRLLRQMSVNDEMLAPFPFKRELSMQAYLLENPDILNIDDVYSDVQIYAEETPVLDGGIRSDSNGRIDIVASYAGEHIAIIELKNAPLTLEHLEQLEAYLKVKEELLKLPIPILSEEETREPKWLGILIGNAIADDVEQKISDGYQYDGAIPIAAMTIQRFRSKTGQVYVTTDTYFKTPAQGKDYTKYIYNGNTYSKRRLVLAVVQNHVATNPDISFSRLSQDFPITLHKGYGVFTTLEEANREYSEKKHKRHFINTNEVLILDDGQEIAVTSQWGIGNIGGFIKRARELGHKID